MQVLDLLVSGAVQGVGFRPLVYRLAHEMSLGGAVWNEPGGVRIRLVGPSRRVEDFGSRLRAECAPPARIDFIRILSVGETEHAELFRIAESMKDGAREALVMPDLATCPACRRELFDPHNRRFRYPFTNCTHCGPRYSIITEIPYDRAHTTMRGFTMCAACQAEYDDPANRRFHAQPNACPECGPRIELLDAQGRHLGDREWALRRTVGLLREGAIVAVKGIGGFHLLCDARHEAAVTELRRRKRREEKPLAVMVGEIETARRLANLGEAEIELLTSAAAPIVLIRRRPEADLAPAIAPGNPYLGLMLPYSPLHHLLMHDVQAPLVATSGNLSDEPICTDNAEAVQRLAGIADAFLVHNRPIARSLDDSVARIVDGKPMLLRRARGFAPLAIPLPIHTPSILAVGPHLKNTVALACRDRVVLSQHLGDLDTLESRRAFEGAVADLQALYAERPAVWAVDRHSDYASSIFAREQNPAPMLIQHHHAHIAAVMAEHALAGPVLGIAWDGTGLGDDGTIWGGEFLRALPNRYLRIARFATFRLPGGDGAMRKPLWSAVGALHHYYPDQMPALAVRRLGLDPATAQGLCTMIEQGVNSPLTSSAGRWFDAIAALTGVCRESAYEGQAAQRLEFAIDPAAAASPYPFRETAEGGSVAIDFKPMLDSLLADLDAGVKPGAIAKRFHLTLIEVIIVMANAHRGMPIVLGGGCFQNGFLLETAIRRLREYGHHVYWPQLVPPNDGGISLGQAFVAAYALPRATTGA